MARPRKINKEVVSKLEQGFKIGLNDTECCVYCEISRETFYKYLKKNPGFSDKIEEWKKLPIAKAKYTIYKNLDDPSVAKWLLERRDKDFSIKVDQNVNGDVKLTPVTFNILPVKSKDEL